MHEKDYYELMRVIRVLSSPALTHLFEKQWHGMVSLDDLKFAGEFLNFVQILCMLQSSDLAGGKLETNGKL